MSLDVAVSWWTGGVGGSRQAIRGNVKAFLDAGHTVDFWPNTELFELAAKSSQYDLIFMPYTNGLDQHNFDAHVHLQMGGLGHNDDVTPIIRSIEHADSVSVLDPSILDFYGLVEYQSEIDVIPNPPNYELFPEQEQPDDGYIFVPKLGGGQKPGSMLVEIAQLAEEETFVVLQVGPELPRFPDNVRVEPPIPLTHMPAKYKGAKAVLNPTTRDVLPNTAYEAFLTNRPYITHPRSIGDVQALPIDRMTELEFPLSVHEFKDWLGSAGEQVQLAETPGEFSTYAMGDLEPHGREYIDAWNGWDWSDKAECVISRM